jgi:uncharacterized membrane protein YkvA (DUF1232 family)
MWFRDHATTWQGFGWQGFGRQGFGRQGFGRQGSSRREFDWNGFGRQRSFRQGSAFRDFTARARRFAADEGELRRRIWTKLKREAANIPFVEDALTAHYCAFDRNTPLYVKLALVGAVVYFLVPDDLIPDSIPVLGYADDAAVLAGAMKMFASHIKPEHRQAAKLMLERMRRA